LNKSSPSVSELLFKGITTLRLTFHHSNWRGKCERKHKLQPPPQELIALSLSRLPQTAHANSAELRTAKDNW
jgi:hypothetical protein